MPDEARNLLAKARIKAFAFEHRIDLVSVVEGRLVLDPVDIPRDMMLGIRRAGGRYVPDKRKLRLPLRYFDQDKLLDSVFEFMEKLAGEDASPQ